MMRLIKLFVLLFLAVCLGLLVSQDPGYALLAYQYWTVEMPLWIFALFCIVLFFFFYGLLRSLHYLAYGSSRFARWRSQRRLKRAQTRTTQGLIAFAEGRWEVAEKQLVQAAEDNESPLLNYLVAARAAAHQKAIKRRDNYLRLAKHANPQAKMAVELSQAQLQMRSGQSEQALATLTHLHELDPKNPYVLELLSSQYLLFSDWDALLGLLPALKKYLKWTPEEAQRKSRLISIGLLEEAMHKASLNVLKAVWHKIPRDMQTDSQTIECFVKGLLEYGAMSEAEALLRQQLKKQYEARLVFLYGRVQHDPHLQLRTVEGWLKSHPNDPIILLAAGRLAIQAQLWGKARAYLENSINLSAVPETLSVLGDLLDQLGETTLSADCYRRGLVAALSSS